MLAFLLDEYPFLPFLGGDFSDENAEYGRTIKVSPWVTGARLYIATHAACRPGCLLTRKLTGNADFLGGKHGK